MTEPSPVREQLDSHRNKYTDDYGNPFQCEAFDIAEWLIDGIESVYRTMQDAYATEDQNIVDSAWDDAMAKLERLLEGRQQ